MRTHAFPVNDIFTTHGKHKLLQPTDSVQTLKNKPLKNWKS